ncbi:hypothetical protein OXPF_13070 [Oxobacter pfennigii]|uniref:Uncharacterized protein n=1 Tax=Oxobacter pfennigii TaxID=36849 RepID=A0A0P9AI91_9CLOT|nr:hypothetical protein [Oxobacter pfennigii]KPU45180.1 hypothetical protein OXPF_13070 [Oxobacter pfennigii]
MGGAGNPPNQGIKDLKKYIKLVIKEIKDSDDKNNVEKAVVVNKDINNE